MSTLLKRAWTWPWTLELTNVKRIFATQNILYDFIFVFANNDNNNNISTDVVYCRKPLRAAGEKKASKVNLVCEMSLIASELTSCVKPKYVHTG